MGVVEEVSQPVSQQSQCGSLHEHDTNPAFPSCLSKSRLLALTLSEYVSAGAKIDRITPRQRGDAAE
jgi:hypothetical protein